MENANTKNNSNNTEISLHTADIKCSKQLLNETKFSLIECFLDVPEYRLEQYVTKANHGFVSELTTQVLEAKVKTNALFLKSMNQIRQA